ncbi:DsbA family protein [Candidatus Gracilibacteria bacterium]|nr:DsbA family protein [Candidatus Gracilibacteria bacterium]
MVKTRKVETDEMFTETSSKKQMKCKHPMFVGGLLFMLVSVGLIIAAMYFVLPKEIATKIMEVEYSKVGGPDNYRIINKMQLEQINNFVKEYKAKNPNDKPTENKNDTSATTPAADSILTKDQLEALKASSFIEGNKDAKITIVEYSDLECPFCIRQAKEGIIKQLRDKYGDKVNNIFKNFRGVPHENSEIEASASLCAGDLGGVEAYSSYYHKIFERSNGGNGTGFSKDNLVPLAKEIGLNEAKFKECLDSKKNVTRFDADTEEGKKMGVQGTPGNVIINNETGKYILIAGAYPVTEFESKIDELLK